MVKVKDVITLLSMSGELLRPLSKKAEWELEELKGSTNRLTIDIPLSDGFGVTTDQEVFFRKKRYVITELSRYRGSSSITAIADEAQIELSDRNIKKFNLKKSTLENAVKKAVSGSKWSVGYVYADDREYFAEIENKSSMHCLSFLESQSGGQLIFDSVNRVVSLVQVQETVPDKVFRYQQNMDDISKTEVQPKATVMYPYGKDGMSVASLNNDLEYIEDFSWYTALGVSLEDARAKYSKEFVWEDSRYIYAGNLLRDAKNKLATMSHPQINYKIKASGLEAEELSLNEAVYVIDEELGIRLKTTVSRLKLCKDSSQNEIELDYLPTSLGDAIYGDTVGDSTGGSNDIAVFLVKNPKRVTVNATPAIAVSASVSVYTSTHFEVGLSIMFECTKAGLLEGYFMMDGTKMPTEIKQTVSEGWYTLGLPFVITQIQEGTKHLDLYLSTTGAINIEAERAELFVKTQGAYGGTSNERPDQTITENIVITPITVEGIRVDVNAVVDVPDAYVLKEHIAVDDYNVGSGTKDDVSVVLEGFITPPDTIPTEPLKAKEEEERGSFAVASNYIGFTLPPQADIDKFIDVAHKDSRYLKVISVGEDWYLFATDGVYIDVDYYKRRINSDAMIYSLGSGTANKEMGTEINWSLLESIIKEHEAYKRSPLNPDALKYLKDIPVPLTDYDYFFIAKFNVGDEVRLYYFNGGLDANRSGSTLMAKGTGWYSYKWEGTEWIYRANSGSTLATNANETDYLKVLFTTADITDYSSGRVLIPANDAEDMELVNLRTPMSRLPDVIPPTDWAENDYFVAEYSSGDKYRIYYYKGNLYANEGSYNLSTKDVSGWYSYEWDGSDWVYRSDSTGYLGSSDTDYSKVMYATQDIVDYNTGELIRPADK